MSLRFQLFEKHGLVFGSIMQKVDFEVFLLNDKDPFVERLFPNGRKCIL